MSLHADVMQEIEWFNTLLKRAKSGEVLAQYWLAEKYLEGKGTQVDRAAAVYWYTRSAKSGYAKSMLLLGRLYIHNATEQKIMDLGIKQLEDLAHYNLLFPSKYEASRHYITRFQKIAYKELIALHMRGTEYLPPNKKKADTYLKELKLLEKESLFRELLESAGIFCADKKRDEAQQALFIKLIEDGADVNATYKKSDEEESSLLMYSIEKNNRLLFELLLEKGADVNFTNKKGKNAFLSAVWQDNLAFAKEVYAHGAKLDFSTTQNNPLLIASLNENRALLSYLVKIGYDPHKNVLEKRNLLEFLLGDSYALAHIVNYNKSRVSSAFIEWVIKEFAFDVNGLYHGQRVFHLVSMQSGMREKVALLLKLGAKKALKNSEGESAQEFYEKLIEKNMELIKKYENSQENRVRIFQTKNKNIQSILDNAFGKSYYNRDKLYKKYNENIREALQLLEEK